MSNQEIEALEWKLFTEESNKKNKHQSLKTKLKSLQEELELTLNSSNKLRIMNQMEIIEQEIKNDLFDLKQQKEFIERKKSQIRQQKYQLQTQKYKQQTALRNAKINQIKASQALDSINISQTKEITKVQNFSNSISIASISIRLKQLENIIDLLISQEFLDLVEMVEAQKVNKVYLSSHFLSLYQVWKNLHKIEKTIHDCRDEISQFESE